VIVEGIVGLIFGFARNILLNALPADDAGASTWDVAGFVHGYAWLNTFLPLDEIFELALLSIQVLVLLAGIWAVTWVLQRFHVMGGGA
jgi:hypothetical protein